MSAPAVAFQRARVSRAESDLEALLVRMRRRQYPESIPVLASYWLKTVYASGYKRGGWKELNGLLKRVLREQVLNAPSREALLEVQAWIQAVVLSGKAPEAPPPRVEPFRASLRNERLAPYVGRLLNEWLPAEVARLLIEENDPTLFPQAGGIPVLAIGKALERLLVRERLSPATLEMLLQPELLSPRDVYPADAEMLRDVVLALLGRTWGPPFPVMPAVVMGVAAGSPLPADYREAVRRAFLVPGPRGEEVHVPIAAAQALEILHGDPVRIGSIIVTMDGRCWESENLQSGERHFVVYEPKGRLRIDYSADHAKLHVAWPDTQLHWRGDVQFRDPFEIFGREWHVSSWETDGERAWLHLVFSRVLPVPETQPPAETRYRRTRPAFIDMAWAAVENALASSILQKNREPIEQMRRADLIPLGRAIFGLAEGLQKREAIETQLKAIRYLESEVAPVYGRVPWKILPARVRTTLLKGRRDPVLLDLLTEAFDSLPVGPSEAARPSPSSHAA